MVGGGTVTRTFYPLYKSAERRYSRSMENNETATTANPWSLYSLEDLFYELEAAEDESKETKAELIRQAIDARVLG